MGARIKLADVFPAYRGAIERRYAEEGLRPHAWSNEPGHRYRWHTHDYTKVLYCLSGTITFHTSDGDYIMQPGDRLEVDAGTEHAATVGGIGVECLEAAVPQTPDG